MKWLPPAIGVLRRPDLWPTAVRQGVTLLPLDWKSSRRLLPDRSYLKFRSLTQYGSADAVPTGPDVVSYLSWCRAWRHTVSSRR